MVNSICGIYCIYNIAYYNRGVAAGESKSKVGTATADKVLAGYTFSGAAGVGIAGTMVNRGTLNWNPTSSTTQTIQPGYYSGGTLDSSGAYAQGFIDGQQNVTQSLQISYTYHKHVDADGKQCDAHEEQLKSGGCFTTPKHTYESYTYLCGGTYNIIRTGDGNHLGSAGNYNCDNGCGNFSPFAGTRCTVQRTGTRIKSTSYTLSCGKTEQSVESATITY